MPPITLPEFIHKWTASTRSEKAAAQEHFIDLCALLGHPTPNTDPTGEDFAFEKGAAKLGVSDGWADVWKRDYFAWEYKGKRKSLVEAYHQLLLYKDDLGNPPLLVVCDLDRFEVHTNFTGTSKQVYAFSLANLASPTPTETCSLPPLDVLRAVFTDPEKLRPRQTTTQVTEYAAVEFATLANSLRQWGAPPDQAAHFLMRLLFCQFAQDIGLLPPHLFTRLVEQTRTRPKEFQARLIALFGAMARGGFFGADDIPHFDGGLFQDNQALDLTGDDLAVLLRTCRLDWGSVEPAIFGTLFERSLDPDKRAQIGAHYTSRADIELIVEPVLMAPLRRRWTEVQREAQAIIARRDAATGAARTRHEQALQRVLTRFADELARIRVLDPACGSGNFLYVALKRLLDLEKEVISFGVAYGLSGFFPQVGPEQLYGLEINPYAQELAQVVVWIGYIQWLHDNGFGISSDPILKPLQNIVRADAILDYDERGQPAEPPWPEVDVIIGNPPFLGGKLLRKYLGDAYVDDLFRLYDGRVPREADLVTYWFERARAHIAAGRARRAGLLATQAIRGGANRRVLERVKATGDIFYAQADRPWVLDGAAVRVSMVGFDDGSESARLFNDSKDDPAPLALANARAVAHINANLTASLDLTRARRLRENLGLAFMGDTKGGPFDIPGDVARRMLRAPLNPNGRPNSDVVRPWVNGLDITRRPRGMWIIDFGVDMPEDQAALYEAPFEYALRHVKPARASSRSTRVEWWLHERPRVDMRAALEPLSRYVATPRVAKHRLFVWLEHRTLADSALIAIARDDDYCFGVLHSRIHELWALSMGTQLREFENGFRYTPTTTFETFPFPWPPGTEPADDRRVEAIAAAARELVRLRDRWLHPQDAAPSALASRTLTALYNQRPAWLCHAHRRLDEAVLDAYGWPHDLPDEAILERLLALNLARASVS